MSRDNDETNWRARLEGKYTKRVDSTTSEPDFGFYRQLKRDRAGWDVYAYWYTDGALRCRCNGEWLKETTAIERWPSVCDNPITYERYKAALAGEPWPGESAAVTLLNRAPPDDSFEGIQGAIDGLLYEAKRLLAKGAATTKDDADLGGEIADKLGKLWKKAEFARKTEKHQWEVRAKAVDDKWRPLLTAAEVYKRLKTIVCQPWLDAETAKKNKAEAEARLRAEAAARVAHEAAEKARREQAERERIGSIKSEVESEKADKAAEAARLAAAQAKREADDIAAQTVTAGVRGRGTSLRTVKTAKIVDYNKCLLYFANNEKVAALIAQLANAAVRAGTTPDGCELKEEQVAA